VTVLGTIGFVPVPRVVPVPPIEKLGRRAVLAASNSLSHLHYDVEPDLGIHRSAR
jgi:hypothetical protein